MKSLIALAIGAAALRMVAKYYKITSWKDIKSLIPSLKRIVPSLN